MVGTDRVSFGPKRLRGLRHGWKCLGVDRNDRFQDWPTGDPWRKLWQLERRNHSARGESTFHDTERSDRFQNRWEPPTMKKRVCLVTFEVTAGSSTHLGGSGRLYCLTPARNVLCIAFDIIRDENAKPLQECSSNLRVVARCKMEGRC